MSDYDEGRMMTYAQHLRILQRSKGRGHVGISHREYIRAAYGLLNSQGKSRAARVARHQWLQAGLEYLRAERVYEAMGYHEWVPYTLMAVLEAAEEGM